MAEKVYEDVTKLKLVRNLIIDWLMLESKVTQIPELVGVLIDLLEKMLELRSRPSDVSTWSESWFDAHKLFVYELFLYIIATLIKTKNHTILNEIFTANYMLPIVEQRGDYDFIGFDSFHFRSDILQSVLSPEKKNLLSPTAEYIKRNSDRSDLTFDEIMQGELLILLYVFASDNGWWYPQTQIYSDYGQKFPFFVRAAQHKNFKNLAQIVGEDTIDILRSKVKKGHERLSAEKWYDFRFDRTFWSSMNMDKLDTIK